MVLCTKWFVLCSVYYIKIYRFYFLLFTVQQKGKSKRLLKCTKTKKTDENKRNERSNWQCSGRRREKEVSRVRLPGKARRRVRRSWLVERGAVWRSSAREETHRPPNTKHHAHTYHTCYLKLHAIYCTAYVLYCMYCKKIVSIRQQTFLDKNRVITWMQALQMRVFALFGASFFGRSWIGSFAWLSWSEGCILPARLLRHLARKRWWRRVTQRSNEINRFNEATGE